MAEFQRVNKMQQQHPMRPTGTLIEDRDEELEACKVDIDHIVQPHAINE